MVELMDRESLTSLNILTSAQNLSPSAMLEVLAILENTALKWPQAFTFALFEHPVAQNRENMRWKEEEWEELEKTLVWCVTQETSKTKLFWIESSVKPTQCPAQAMTNVYATSGQGDGSFLSEAHRL